MIVYFTNQSRVPLEKVEIADNEAIALPDNHFLSKHCPNRKLIAWQESNTKTKYECGSVVSLSTEKEIVYFWPCFEDIAPSQTDYAIQGIEQSSKQYLEHGSDPLQERNSTQNSHNPILIIAGIVFLIYIIVTAISPSTSSSSKGSQTCGICGGSGWVTFKMLGEGSGYKVGDITEYRCKGCHGTGYR